MIHNLKFADCEPITSCGDVLYLSDDQRKLLQNFLLFGGPILGGEIKIGCETFTEGDLLTNHFPRRICYLSATATWDEKQTAGEQIWVVSKYMGFSRQQHLELLENYFSRFRAHIDWALPMDVLTEQEKMHLAIFRAMVMRAKIIIIDGVFPKESLLAMIKAELAPYGVCFLNVRMAT